METKALIAIVTCRSRIGTWGKAIRDSWLPHVPPDKADARFFVGRGEDPVPDDVIVLNCNDLYQGLPEKVREIMRWSLAQGYHHTLKCDDDVVLKPVPLLASGYELNDFTGRENRPPQPYVVPMGFNYWLSRKSMKIIANAELPEGFDDEKWVSKNLWAHGIELVDDKGYFLHHKPLEYSTRPIRMTRRPPRYNPPDSLETTYFSRCIHISAEPEVKLQEFRKVYARYGPS